MNQEPLKLSILMPVRNEGVNIRIMLKVLRSFIEIPYEILIIYDDPNDSSIQVVQKLQPQHPYVKLVFNQNGSGVTNALNAGIAASKGEYILIFGVDEVGPVVAIDDMLALMEEGCDLVSCTRYAHGGKRLGGSWIGGILSRLANKLFCRLSGSVLTDATTGIKMIRKSKLQELTLESRAAWAVVFEIAIKAQIAKFRLGETPIVSIDRLYGGKSSFVLWSSVKEYFRWFIYGMKNLKRSSKRQKIKVRLPSFLN